MAVRAITQMTQFCVNRAVLDVAGAIDCTRPLEMIADACGCGWRGVCLQMKSDMAGLNVLMIVGEGFAEPRQRWQPLHAEASAQPVVKRAQKNTSGVERRHVGQTARTLPEPQIACGQPTSTARF